MGDRKDRNIYYSMAGVLILTLAVFMAFTYFYIQKFDKTLEEENQTHLAELAEHTVTYTQSVVENLQGSLENAAGAVSIMPEDKRFGYLNDMVSRQGFAFAGYAWKDGNLHTTEETQDADISDADYYIEAMQGKNTVTNLTRRVLTNRVVSGIILAVPVRNLQGEPEGILMAMLDISRLRNALDVESFGGEGYSYIIDSEGNLVLHNKSMDYSNFYRVLNYVQIEGGKTPEQIQDAIRSGESGMITYEQLGSSRYAYYCPLGFNGWTVVNIVSKDVVTQKTAALTRDLIMLSVSAFVLFTALFVLAGISWIHSQNQRHAAETKSTFLANVSHEIRTPMNAIVGMSEVLLRENLNRKQEECVRCIQDSGKNLISIINDILDISKIESGKFTIRSETYDMRGLLNDIAAIAVIRIGREPIRFWVEIDRSVPERLTGDKIRLQQIAINLIGNAVKFTDQGHIRLSVSAEEKNGSLYLQMKISDTGIGIKKQDISQLFISFNQIDTNKPREKEGTGLGLAIAKSLCEMMGGDITVESEYGKGSTFTVTVQQQGIGAGPLLEVKDPEEKPVLIMEHEALFGEYYRSCLQQMNLPCHICTDRQVFEAELHSGKYRYILADQATIEAVLNEAVATDAGVGILVKQEEYLPMEENSQYATIFVPLFSFQILKMLDRYETGASNIRVEMMGMQPVQPMPGVKMLIVDDNWLNLEIAQSLMEPYQMDIDCASSGAEAVQAVLAKDYDIILMDHMMPEMDGVETLQAIRNLPDEKYRRIPVVMLTANAIDGAQDMYMEKGFNGFLTKPVDMKEVERMLQRLLR